ncbi:MAG: hypothetical protein ACM3JD_20025, partial [Rudaea sp.]
GHAYPNFGSDSHFNCYRDAHKHLDLDTFGNSYSERDAPNSNGNGYGGSGRERPSAIVSG